MLSDDIRCSEKGGAQQTVPAGAGTARPELRWVGAQHLMYGYCGRAAEDAAADLNAAATRVAAAAGGARAYSVRPAALLEARRHLVVRIGPRGASPPGGGDIEQTRARAA